jgi:hypothetical protein
MSTTTRNLSEEISSLERIHNRLNIASNEDYTSLVNHVLPKLLGMMNDSRLRPTLIPIMSSILKRVKQLQSCLSLGPLFELVSTATMPFTCNFAITFIDVIIKNLAERNLINAIDAKEIAAIFRISQFPIFSSQHNALCAHFLAFMWIIPAAYLEYCSQIAVADNADTENKRVRLIFSDWVLDIVLLQPLVKGSIGSIVPGLSGERIDRITSKQIEWPASYLKQMKTVVLESLLVIKEASKPPLLIEEYMIVIAIILSVDLDASVALAARTRLENLKSMNIMNELRLTEIVSSLITGRNLNNPLLDASTTRSRLKDEVAHALISWMNINMSESYVKFADSLLAVSLFLLTGSGSSSRSFSHASLRVEGAALDLLQRTGEVLSDSQLSATAPSIVEVVMESLSFHMSSIQNQTAAQRSTNLLTASQEIILSRKNRAYCYDLVKLLSMRNSALSADVSLTMMLFRLVDLEDTETVPRLFEALHFLRESHEISSSHDHADAINSSSLKAFLLVERDSKEPKKRKLVLQWIKSICHWSSETIESLYKSYGKLHLQG